MGYNEATNLGNLDAISHYLIPLPAYFLVINYSLVPFFYLIFWDQFPEILILVQLILFPLLLDYFFMNVRRDSGL